MYTDQQITLSLSNAILPLVKEAIFRLLWNVLILKKSDYLRNENEASTNETEASTNENNHALKSCLNPLFTGLFQTFTLLRGSGGPQIYSFILNLILSFFG